MANETVHMISEINRRKKDWNLRVKILRVWTKEFVLSAPTMHLILCDEEGNRISANLSGEALNVYAWLKHFKRYWFSLKDFSVSFGFILGQTTCHSYEIDFNSNTKMKLLADFPNHHHFLVFTPIVDILSQTVSERYPIDVLGVITWVGKINKRWWNQLSYEKPRMRAMVQFTIRNQEFKGLECLAYGKLAEELSRRFCREHEWHIFGILRCFRVSTLVHHSWLTAEEGLSDIEFEDYTFPELYQFLNRYPFPLPQSYNNDHKQGFTPF